MFPLFLTFLVFAWQSEIEEKNICSSDKTDNKLNNPQQKTYTYRCFAKYKFNDTNQENLVFAFTLNKFSDEENQICDHFTRFQKELFDFTVIKFINNVQILTKNLTFSNKKFNDAIIKNLEITKSFIEVENDYRANGKYDLLVCYNEYIIFMVNKNNVLEFLVENISKGKINEIDLNTYIKELYPRNIYKNVESLGIDDVSFFCITASIN